MQSQEGYRITKAKLKTRYCRQKTTKKIGMARARLVSEHDKMGKCKNSGQLTALGKQRNNKNCRAGVKPNVPSERGR